MGKHCGVTPAGHCKRLRSGLLPRIEWRLGRMGSVPRNSWMLHGPTRKPKLSVSAQLALSLVRVAATLAVFRRPARLPHLAVATTIDLTTKKGRLLLPTKLA